MEEVEAKQGTYIMNTKLFTGLSLAILLAFSPAVAAEKAEKKPAEATATTKAQAKDTTKSKAKAPVKKAKAKKAKKAPVSNADWAGLPVENKKGEKLGEVVEAVPAKGKVKSIIAKLGDNTVKISAKKAKRKGDKVVVSLSAKQLKKLPKVKK
ncbi:MAG: hypothetical protein P8Y67_01605 [Alphaproteobacteria bacterium]